ncbi:MAG TPA: PIG-L family deacetylase [Woeseiaceae bacterium]
MNALSDLTPALPLDPAAALVSLTPDPTLLARLLVVVAHPDDETLALGPLLPQLRQATFVYATDGAPRNLTDAHAAGCATRDAYAGARRAELEAMFTQAGLTPGQARFCGLPDQEAMHALAWLARCVQRHIEESRAGLVVTHPYEGGHPDHEATAFAVHAACALLANEGRAAPAIVEAPCYHRRRDGRAAYGEFLAHPGMPQPRCRALTQDEQALKRRLLACFGTQAATLALFPLERQSLRRAPRYDFTCAPHSGALHYEVCGWGSGHAWRRRARGGLRELGLTQEWRAHAGSAA